MQPLSYKNKKGKRVCDPIGWWYSEKLDGIKGRWIEGVLYTRSGKKLLAPKWFTDLLPKNINMEGELYFGKKTFHKTGGLRSRSNTRCWEKAKFIIFDLIDYKLDWMERHLKMLEIDWYDTVYPLKWKKIKSIAYLEGKFEEIIKQNGEGIILADPKGMYVDGYVTHVLKYKKAQTDEAIVIGYNVDETGKKLSSLKVKKGNITFHIGSGFKLKERYDFKERIPISTMVSYSFEGLGKNRRPRFPIFLGIRFDL